MFESDKVCDFCELCLNKPKQVTEIVSILVA